VKWIIGQTDFKNRIELTTTFVKLLLEVIWQRKIIAKFNSYVPEMVNSYVFTEHRFTIFSGSESAPLAVKADNS
jgi:hypothetical protein